MGSASELEYLLLSALDLEILPPREWQRLNEQVLEVKRMLSTLIKALRTPGAAASGRPT
jgi:four helix bundle protein